MFVPVAIPLLCFALSHHLPYSSIKSTHQPSEPQGTKTELTASWTIKRCRVDPVWYKMHSVQKADDFGKCPLQHIDKHQVNESSLIYFSDNFGTHAFDFCPIDKFHIIGTSNLPIFAVLESGLSLLTDILICCSLVYPLLS